MHNIRVKPYRHGKIRFLALFLASMLMFGNQYAFNNPQALEETFQEVLDINETQFNLLYTIFAFPNIFTTLVIGMLIDFLGVRVGVISLSVGVALAQVIVAFGGQYESYRILLLGRMIFGIASESLITAQASIVSFWFKGKELATALGIILTSPQLGNALNSLLTPKIYERTQSLGAPLFVSVAFCFVSVLCGVVLVLIDMKADRIDAQNQELLIQYYTLTQGFIQDHGAEKVKCSDIKKLNGTFWIIMFLCMFALSEYIPFMDNANRLYQRRFCFSQVGAGKAIMLTYLVCVVVSPFIGMLVDRVGKRRYFIILTIMTFFLAHFYILIYPSCTNNSTELGSMAGLVFIGFGYAMYSNCLVPVIPIIVKPQITGTAFGLMAMVQSFALATFPLISSYLVSSTENPQVGFRYSSLFYTSMAGLGMVLSMSLFLIDKKLRRKLDSVNYEQIPFTEVFVTDRQGSQQGEVLQLVADVIRQDDSSGSDSLKQHLLSDKQREGISPRGKKVVSFDIQL